ncbi:MAG: hypothetical protein NTX17_07665 [Candidatus Eisenbacteria bacterium]|nr:hypothetical protein [Candidatus Eisenbacteria bacterium]
MSGKTWSNSFGPSGFPAIRIAFFLLLLVSFASVLGCAHPQAQINEGMRPEREPDTTITFQSAVSTRVMVGSSATTAATIDLRVLQHHAQERQYAIIRSSPHALRFALDREYQAIVEDTGNVLVVCRSQIATLGDKDVLETKLERVLQLISDIRPDFPTTEPGRTYPSLAFAKTLYENAEYYTGDFRYQSVILTSRGQGVILQIPINTRVENARVAYINGPGCVGSRVLVRGVNYEYPYLRKPGGSVSLDLAAGQHSLEWAACPGQYFRLEFITRGKGNIDLGGVGAANCKIIWSRNIAEASLANWH